MSRWGCLRAAKCLASDQATRAGLGPQDVCRRDTQGGDGCCQGEKVACALASVARGRPVKTVCKAFGRCAQQHHDDALPASRLE